MFGIWNRDERRTGDAAREFSPVVERNPLVVFTPQDRHRATYLVVPPLDLSTELVVHLCDLTPKSLLSLVSKPWLQIELHFVRAQRVRDRAADIGAKHGFMDIGRQTGKRFLVFFCRLNQGRSLGADRDRIDQHQGAIIEPVEQVAAQRDGAAEVMRHDVGPLQLPVSVERREQLVLNAARHVRVGLGGLPVAEHVEIVDPAPLPEPSCNPPPFHRRERGTMKQDRRRAVADRSPCNRVTRINKAFGQGPVIGWHEGTPGNNLAA